MNDVTFTFVFPVWILFSWAGIMGILLLLWRIHRRLDHLDHRLGPLTTYQWMPVATAGNIILAVGMDPDQPIHITAEQRIKIRDRLVKDMCGDDLGNILGDIHNVGDVS